MRTIPVTHGMFCWFELTTRDAKRGADFYAALAELTVQEIQMGPCTYRILSKGTQAIGGVMPMDGPEWPADLPNHWVPYIAVDDVDAAAARLAACGGRLCCGPSDIPIGRFAMASDPAGAVFALFKGAPGKVDGTNPIGDGTIVWCELGVPDPDAACSFYGSLLGWTFEHRTSEGFDYQVVRCAGGVEIGSIYRHCPKGGESAPRPAWRPYLQVASAKDALARAVELGAALEWEPMPIPGMGRFAGIVDPTGTAVTLFEPK